MHKIIDPILIAINIMICLFLYTTIFILYVLSVKAIFSFILILPFIFIWLKVHTIIFEMGHLIAGWISGYTFRLLRIGSFAFYRDSTGALKCSRMKIRGISGQCLMEPPHKEAEQCPYILYLLGGSLLNLFIGILATLLYGFLLPHNPITFFTVCEMGVISICIGISNLLPCKFRGISNDGYQLVTLSSSPTARTLWHLSQEVYASLYKIDSMKDFPQWIIDRLKNMNWPYLAHYQAHSLYAFLAWLYLSEGDYEAYYNHHLKILATDGICEAYKNESWCECLFYEILRGSAPNVIDRIYNRQLQKYVHLTRNTPARKRLLYAYYHLYRRDEVKAQKQYQQLRKFIGNYMLLAELNMELHIVEQLASIDPAALA